jgi:RNA polymerase sigma factor (sigma-70 family)
MQRITNDGVLNATERRLKELFVRGLAGDEAAYRAFLHDLIGHLRGYMRRRLNDLPFDAEDLVQEALLAVHNQRHTYDVTAPLTAWVHAIARYKLVDFWRRRSGREQLNEVLDEESEVFASQAMAEAADAKRDVRKLLEGLPDRQRLPILYVKLQGLSVAETARLTGMSESAVKVGIHRGLKVLAAQIRDES